MATGQSRQSRERSCPGACPLGPSAVLLTSANAIWTALALACALAMRHSSDDGRRMSRPTAPPNMTPSKVCIAMAGSGPAAHGAALARRRALWLLSVDVLPPRSESRRFAVVDGSAYPPLVLVSPMLRLCRRRLPPLFLYLLSLASPSSSSSLRRPLGRPLGRPLMVVRSVVPTSSQLLRSS